MYRPAEVHICRYTCARAGDNTNAERNRRKEGESERRPAAMCTRTIYLEPRRNRRRVYESRLGGLNWWLRQLWQPLESCVASWKVGCEGLTRRDGVAETHRREGCLML